jgi:hypothetical protein
MESVYLSHVIVGTFVPSPVGKPVLSNVEVARVRKIKNQQ